MVKPARGPDVETEVRLEMRLEVESHSRISLQAMEVLGVTAYEYNKLPEISDENYQLANCHCNNCNCHCNCHCNNLIQFVTYYS